MTSKSRSNDLHSYRAIGPMLRDSLIQSVLGADYATAPQRREPLPPRAYHGPNRYNGSPPVREPDEVILEIRRLAEQQGMPPSAIRAELASRGIAVDTKRINNIRNYCTRAHLVPQPGASTYLTKT